MTSSSQVARSAVVWNVGFNILRDLLQFATMIVLVRLLPPASYGEFALVSSITTFIAFVTFPNFISYALQVKSDSDVHFQDHFTAGLYIQTAAFILVNIFAFALRFFPSYQGISEYIHVMSINLILSLPHDLRRIMLLREYKWKKITTLNVIGVLAGAVAGLLLALSGAGTYSLLLPSMLMTFPYIYDLFMNAKWRPTLAFQWKNYRPAFSFGITRISSGAIVGGRSIVEAAALAVILGFSGLGVYNRAIGLAQMFCGRFSALLMEAIYPVLTRVSDAVENTRRVGDLVIRLVAWVSIPIAVTLGTLSQQVVHVIYGDQWERVATLLRWALAASVSASLIAAGNTLLLSRQKPRLCVAIDFAMLSSVIIALLIARKADAEIYLLGINLMQLVLLFLVAYLLFQQGAISLKGAFSAALAPLLGSSVAWISASIVVAPPSILISTTQILLHSILWGGVFAFTYTLVLRVIFTEMLKGLIDHFPMRGAIHRVLYLK